MVSWQAIPSSDHSPVPAGNQLDALSADMSRSCLSLLILAVVMASFSGCAKREPQSTLEHQTVIAIANMLMTYEFRHPSVHVTNLAQIYTGLNKPYPHRWHHQFARYGKDAGFTNSFYGRYVFLPAGLTNRFVEGELVMMNAVPFPDSTGRLGRMVLSRVGGTYQQWRFRWFAEQDVQSLFAQLGTTIPKPQVMPPAPHEGKRVWEVSRPETREFPLWMRMQLGIMDLCQWLGVNPSWAYWIQWALIALVVLLVGIALVQLGRRLLRRS
jgi:hypothetical protein